MWLYVMFDLPTETKAQRRHAARFRKDLLKDGFSIHQYSVYVRHCASNEAATVHTKRIKNMGPDEGLRSVLKVTNKQFGDTVRFIGRKRQPPPKQPMQLELF
jgi:CRISPR-associated protein Cas2